MTQKRASSVAEEPLRIREMRRLLRAHAITNERFRSDMDLPLHTRDADCTVDPETSLCVSCGVDHSRECPDCGQRGYHSDGCFIGTACDVPDDSAIAQYEAFWSVNEVHA